MDKVRQVRNGVVGSLVIQLAVEMGLQSQVQEGAAGQVGGHRGGGHHIDSLVQVLDCLQESDHYCGLGCDCCAGAGVGKHWQREDQVLPLDWEG